MFGNVKLAHLACMDLFIHTSRWEGMPMAALEAAALGKPLLVSKATNLGEYVTKYGNGIVLPDNLSKMITESLYIFYNSYNSFEDKEMGDKSIKLIKGELNWSKIAKSMVEKLYLLKRKVNGSG